ncbi:flavodoxin reductase [Microbacterium sp. Root53]|uniref:FAD-dependent oxidoreductase n=1 Tax=Microbacterium sp. Root53 TaxID=1736553 RepID=UPI0006FE80DD|nr:FAD-dependent oxidoreductase [Microbacterium sp. Root53]KQZ05050.1 flavodoxin reductase [Microbacterium sp. Root53]
MIGRLTAVYQRGMRQLGRLSMYRLVLLALGVLTLVALALSFFGLVLPSPAELLATAAVLVAVAAAVDVVAHRVLRLVWRPESTLITAAILVFVVRPGLDVATLAGAAIAAAAASLSKYLIVWRGRHILNPAAFGATVATLSTLGGSAWWVGTPALFAPLLLVSVLVLWRTEKLRVVALFYGVAVVVAAGRTIAQLYAAGAAMPLETLLQAVLVQSPYLFLGAFMLSEPLTLPPRRWQQYLVAVAVGALAGWPIPLGVITLGQERALLIGNLIAFAFAARGAVRLTLRRRTALTPTVQELAFTAKRPVRFAPGQYLELDVPHRHADARGTRREFSISSAPEDLPEIRIAFRESRTGTVSSYKRALAAARPGDVLAVTGVWGDFTLPRSARTPVLMVAAGIGVTPFVSQLRHLRLAGETRDVVLVYAASSSDELAYRAELEATRVRTVVYTRDEPADLPAHWTWAGGERLTAEGLHRAVPDLSRRHAYVSGPPALIADLAPALGRAHGLTTDAFAGY